MDIDDDLLNMSNLQQELDKIKKVDSDDNIIMNDIILDEEYWENYVQRDRYLMLVDE